MFVGLTSIDGYNKILIGSKKTVLKHSLKDMREIIRLTQGNKSKSEIASKIVVLLIKKGYLDEKYKDDYKDDLINRLPNGKFYMEVFNRETLEKT